MRVCACVCVCVCVCVVCVGGVLQQSVYQVTQVGEPGMASYMNLMPKHLLKKTYSLALNKPFAALLYLCLHQSSVVCSLPSSPFNLFGSFCKGKVQLKSVEDRDGVKNREDSLCK